MPALKHEAELEEVWIRQSLVYAGYVGWGGQSQIRSRGHHSVAKAQAFKKNETWDLLPLPAEVKPISCKWVYKVKRGSDGSVEGTRLLARAFSQQYGIDYDETARGKAKMTTMWVLISLAARKSWRLWRMDVKNAFLYCLSLHPSPAFSLPCIHTTRIPFHIPSQAQASPKASFPDLRLELQKKWRESSRSYLGFCWRWLNEREKRQVGRSQLAAWPSRGNETNQWCGFYPARLGSTQLDGDSYLLLRLISRRRRSYISSWFEG